MQESSKFLVLAAAFAIVSACHSPQRFPGYTETDTGLLYKLQAIGEGHKQAKFGDYLELGITYKTENDSAFLDTYSTSPIGTVILPFNHSSFTGSFEEGLTSLSEGDSVSYIVAAEPLFRQYFRKELPMFIRPGSVVKMDVRLCRILDETSYREELKRCDQVVEDRDIEEQRKLQAFLDTCGVQFTPLANGIYYSPERQGSGDLPEPGDKVRIGYKGYFINGKMFESSYERGQPLEFVYGEQGQVIRGIESAISFMKEGSKAKFIIPSQLAYGAEGSSTGVIPPYSTVLYEIELLNLTK